MAEFVTIADQQTRPPPLPSVTTISIISLHLDHLTITSPGHYTHSRTARHKTSQHDTSAYHATPLTATLPRTVPSDHHYITPSHHHTITPSPSCYHIAHTIPLSTQPPIAPPSYHHSCAIIPPVLPPCTAPSPSHHRCPSHRRKCSYPSPTRLTIQITSPRPRCVEAEVLTRCQFSRTACTVPSSEFNYFLSCTSNRFPVCQILEFSPTFAYLIIVHAERSFQQSFEEIRSWYVSLRFGFAFSFNFDFIFKYRTHSDNQSINHVWFGEVKHCGLSVKFVSK